MATEQLKEKPVVVIVGPTASGKTSLAIDIAKQYDGEIICADSRTIYKEMTIGTAKPTMQDQQGIPHWGIDLVTPDERYTVAEFKQYADEKIADIRARQKLPLLVGGTGLYIDAVVFDYKFPSPLSQNQRLQLEDLTPEELYEYCNINNISLPFDRHNKRRLIHAISTKHEEPKKNILPMGNSIIVGIATKKIVLNDRINQRAEQMFDDGVVKEATQLGKKYGWETEAMTASIYQIVQLYLVGGLSLQETVDKFTTKDRQLAKRQMTWFRRNPSIEWCTLPEAKTYIVQQLAQEYDL